MTDAGAPPGPPEDVGGLVRDGQAKFASGDVEEARSAFARALKLKPDDAGARAGLERCERLLKEQAGPPADPGVTPPWPSDDFPDSGENPEATIVDPNYLVGIPRGPDAGASGEFPEPLTVPRTPAIDGPGEAPSPPKLDLKAKLKAKARAKAETGPEPDAPPPPAETASGTAPAPEAPAPGPGEPAYPRYVSTLPGNYPEVRPGGRPAVASPPPVAPGTPPPAPAPVVYPQMPPGGPSAYPQYATPVGGYMPSPAAGPMDLAALERRRWLIICGSVGAGCLLLGLLLGWAIFGAADEEEPEAGSVVPLVAGDAGTGAARPADAGQATRTAPAGAASARVSAIERPVLATLTAPTAGDVLRLHARAAAQVKAGARLYTIRGGKKARLPEAVVEAPRAGRFEVRAAEGDTVAEGEILGLVVDPAAWLLIGDLTGEAIAPAWRCEVASADGASRAPCRIDSVEHIGGGRARAAARVAAKDADWLRGDEKDLTITVSPP